MKTFWGVWVGKGLQKLSKHGKISTPAPWRFQGVCGSNFFSIQCVLGVGVLAGPFLGVRGYLFIFILFISLALYSIPHHLVSRPTLGGDTSGEEDTYSMGHVSSPTFD